MVKILKAGILGASGYTGAELIRILDRHPYVELISLAAHNRAGQTAQQVFTHLPSDLPDMTVWQDMPLAELDVLFMGLPHGTSAEIAAQLYDAYPTLRLIDLSADFRLNSAAAYQSAYNIDHPAPHLLDKAVYGLSEIYAQEIAAARLIACPGCYCTTAELALIPLLKAGVLQHDNIIIDAKSGVSGAGRNSKADFMFTEVNQSMHAYAVGTHRHRWEIDQELSLAAGQIVQATFTPHLIPVNRGIIATIYTKLNNATSHDIIDAWNKAYVNQPFIRILDHGCLPKTQHVIGCNSTHLGVADDPKTDQVVLVSVLDNLQKGASGQAVQNMNLMFGYHLTTGLDRIALYP